MNLLEFPPCFTWSPCGDLEEVKVVPRAAASAQIHFATPRSELSAWAHAAQQLHVYEDDVSCPASAATCYSYSHQQGSDECPSAPHKVSHKERMESTQAGEREKVVEEPQLPPEARKSWFDEVVYIAVSPGRRGHFGWIDTTARKESIRSPSNTNHRCRSPSSRSPSSRRLNTTTRDAVEVEIPLM